MSNYLRELWTFIWSVVGRVSAYVTGGVVAAVAAVYEHFAGRNVPLRAFEFGLGAFLLVAFYQTWRDQYRQTSQLSEDIRQNRTPASPVAAVSGETGARILTPGDNRIFIDKSPRELLAPFRSGLTNYQADKLLSDYVDKWVCWIVKITNVTQIGERASVSTYIQDVLRLGIIVTMYFPEAARVIHLDKGTMIKVEGQIKEMFSDEVKLENCRLVEVRPSS